MAGFGANLVRLLAASVTGAAVYVIVLLGLWLASRRPDGPEADILGVVRRVGARLPDFSRRAAFVPRCRSIMPDHQHGYIAPDISRHGCGPVAPRAY